MLKLAAAARLVSNTERDAFDRAVSLLGDPDSRLESSLLLLRLRPPRRRENVVSEAPAAPLQPVRKRAPVQKTEHWIEIELALPDGKSVAGERFRIITPDDREIHGVTDSRGRARVDGIVAEGSCTISFIDLYDDEWRHA